MSAGSNERKLKFDDVTVDHKCKCTLPARPNVIKKRVSDDKKLVLHLLHTIIIWSDNPNTKKHFHSSEEVYNEITRHIFSNYWYIIHPYSCFRFYWNSVMAVILNLSFLFIPFTYAFYQDLGVNNIWVISISIFLNFFCHLDILFNFFTGYRSKHSSVHYIVLNQSSIIRNYLKGRFIFDFLPTLPTAAIYRLYFDAYRYDETKLTIALTTFHLAFLCKFFRFASLNRAQNYVEDLMNRLKLSHVTKIIIVLALRTIFFLQFSTCAFKVVVSSIFFYIYSDEDLCNIIKMLLNPNIATYVKYYTMMYFIIWALFDTSFSTEFEIYISGKIITAGCMIIAYLYNIYCLVVILNLVNIINAPKTKYYETINQLDAYMKKKQFPMYLQSRVKYFYMKKFKRAYYREQEILSFLSEPLKREILINTDKLFVERVKLFQDIPNSLVSSIAASCRKEQFLPNDLIITAGTVGECMFFIASGSVCVTTTNGQELCHLEDGDYFGEIAFTLKNRKRIANIMAIEFCEIYILDYVNLKKYVQINGTIMQKLTSTANKRMELTLEAEEIYKKQLHERTTRHSFDSEG
ncbi:hypothetical protein PVAND_009011 [Polypedilum vanderplanki]|uniref:Cyclic nucleotide-binding domain-containing protein n=1 Tax=Polypedilum vanderplanki TaxID=319348 RepID=A0A9J6CCT5_POLVA|nr:hypothetical protein PVAND_009011 [Polypedilum vanderplanki]